MQLVLGILTGARADERPVRHRDPSRDGRPAHRSPSPADGRRGAPTARRLLAGRGKRTGQPFTQAALDRNDWSYDTEPSCRAVVAMRELAPHEALRWVARLHRAFYVEGVDVTDSSVFPSLLDGFDVDRDRFAGMLTEETTIERTRQDFAEAQRYGVSGFPTVLFRDGDELGVVTRGFVPWDQLEPGLTRWLEDQYGDLAMGLVCDPETGLC